MDGEVRPNRRLAVCSFPVWRESLGRVCMKENSAGLGPREQQIAELLLQGCDNDEIAKQLKMARRTVKAHFNRLFFRFGITDGIKREKLETFLYRGRPCP